MADLAFEWVTLDTWQARQGDHRYQIRQSDGQMGPWFLDIYDDAKSSPGNVARERAPNMSSMSECKFWANMHASTAL